MRRWTRVMAAAAVIAAIALPACTGQVDTDEPGPGDPGPTGSPDPPQLDPVAVVERALVTVELSSEGRTAIVPGVLVSDEGHVLLTAFGLIDMLPDEATVTLSDGESADAAVVAGDQLTGLAMVQLADAPQVPPVVLTGEATVDIGAQVQVLSPTALPVTGEVLTPQSAHATVPAAVVIDASVQAGAVVVDAAGDVVGMVSASVEGEGAQTLAVPPAVAARVAGQLMSGGPVVHPYLGVELEERAEGMLLRSVADGSPAAGAGLRAQDVITHIDGRAVTFSAEMSAAVLSREVGDEVTVTFHRFGSEDEVTVTLGEMPA